MGGFLDPVQKLIFGGDDSGGVLGDVFDPVKDATGGLVDIEDLVRRLTDLPVDTLNSVFNAVPGLGSTDPGAGPSAETFITLNGDRGAAINLTGFSGGNGRTANRTIVETLDLAKQTIVARRFLPGTPYLMNSEITAAKKVFRQTAKLHGRMPRRTVRESETTKLKNAAVQAAIANVTCPPPPCK